MSKKISCIQFLENHAWYMQQCFNLTHYKIYIADKPLKGKEKDWGDLAKDFPDANMVTRIVHQYLTSEILAMPQLIEEYNEGARYPIIEDLCHEITHIFTNKVWDGKDKDKFFLEETTQHLSKLLMANYDMWMKKNKIDYKTGLIKK